MIDELEVTMMQDRIDGLEKSLREAREHVCSDHWNEARCRDLMVERDTLKARAEVAEARVTYLEFETKRHVEGHIICMKQRDAAEGRVKELETESAADEKVLLEALQALSVAEARIKDVEAQRNDNARSREYCRQQEHVLAARVKELEQPHEAFLAGYQKNWDEAMENHRKLYRATQSMAAQIHVMREALKIVDDWWFDPSDEKRGACSNCEANLHKNCMGKHQQLNGDPCPIQAAHDALAIPKSVAERWIAAMYQVVETSKLVDSIFCDELKPHTYTAQMALRGIHLRELHDRISDLTALGQEHRGDEGTLIEIVASECHRQWAGWTTHLLSKMVPHEETGVMQLGQWAVDRWTRQINTPYDELSESEKESDRIEARKILAALAQSKGGI